MCGAANGAAGRAAEPGAAPVVQTNSPAELAARAAAGGGESQSAAWPAAAHSIGE
jgi:hypothetical protein